MLCNLLAEEIVYTWLRTLSDIRDYVIKSLFLFFLALITMPVFSGQSGEEDYRNDLDAVVEHTRRMLQTSNRRAVAEWVTQVVDDRLLNSNSEEVFSSGIWSIFNVVTAPSKYVSRSWSIDNMRDHPDYDAYEGMARLAWENQLGNCGENSYVTYYILKKAGAEGHVRILESGEKGAHSFTVWDMPPDAMIDDPLTWGDALVIDPWLGRVLSGQEAMNNKWFKNGDPKTPIRDATCDHDEEAVSWNTIRREEMKRTGRDLNPKADPANEESYCFIATAVYGTPYHENIVILQTYRDQILRKSFFGRLFIDAYETFGPLAAYYIRDNEKRKVWVKKHIVEPAVKRAKNNQ